MKKKILIWFLVIMILGTGFGCCYYYRDTINETINGWIENFISDKTESSYSKLETLFVQMDNNDNEIEKLNNKIEENQLLIEEKLLNNSAENLAEIEKLKAVNEVFKSRIFDLENENKNLESEIMSLQDELSLTQSQLEELKNQIVSLNNRINSKASVQLLVRNSTYSEGTYTLPSTQQFNNYSVLYFIFYNSGTDQYQSMTLPFDAFSTYKNFEIQGGDASNTRWMKFGYKNNTQYFIGSNKYMEFRAIYGLTK